MKKLFGLILSVILLAARPAYAEQAVIADAQFKEFSEYHYLLCLRSSSPQAFDLFTEPNGNAASIRLYNARLGGIQSIGETPFGVVDFAEEATDGNVLVEIDLNSPSHKVTVKHGDDASIVNISVDATPDTEGPAIENLRITDVTDKSVVLRWVTNEPATSQVFYGDSQPEGQETLQDNGLVTEHAVQLTQLEPDTRYFARVKSLDAASNVQMSGSVIFTTEVPADPAFRESGGIVTFEAEHFDNNFSGWYGYRWVLGGFNKGYSGSGYMVVPDKNVYLHESASYKSPHLVYKVNFQNTGTYYVWVRGRGATGGDDSIHAGLNGKVLSGTNSMSGYSPVFSWSNNTMDGESARFTVTETGMHSFDLWMREDGFQVDKILLTTDSSFVPQGDGPAESSR